MKRRTSIDWAAVAGRLGSRIPPERLHPAVLAWASGKGAEVRKSWAVALSGGADSTALLLLIWAGWPGRRDRLVVLHFNHRLRGRAAAADERFCRRLAEDLGVRFRSGRWRTPRRRAGEAAARDARFSFFRSAMRKADARALWLGHQEDDIAESLLMKLARGSGTSALAAPRPVQPIDRQAIHLRPLLPIAKAELREALRKAGGSWCEDDTNTEDGFLRNRIRNRVIPAWKRAVAPRSIGTGTAISRELLEEDAVALDTWLREIAPLRRNGSLDLGSLAGKPRALLRRALHIWLRRIPVAVDLSRQGFCALLEAAESGKATRQSLGKSGFAVIRGGLLNFERLSGRRRK